MEKKTWKRECVANMTKAQCAMWIADAKTGMYLCAGSKKGRGIRPLKNGMTQMGVDRMNKIRHDCPEEDYRMIRFFSTEYTDYIGGITAKQMALDLENQFRTWMLRRGAHLIEGKQDYYRYAISTNGFGDLGDEFMNSIGYAYINSCRKLN